jgi:hypothetical protein
VLPAGVDVGYTTETDGSIDILTLVPGWFGLGADITPPSASGPVTARFTRGALTLAWQPATDNGGAIASYDILFDGSPVASVSGRSRRAVVRAFHPTAQTVYRVRATDAAGNAGKPSPAIVVLPTKRPADVPKQLPRWSFDLFASQHGGGTRPAAAPHKLPAWYWHWAAWRLAPFHLRRYRLASARPWDTCPKEGSAGPVFLVLAAARASSSVELPLSPPYASAVP